jgi:hypothetical protein
MFACGGKTKEKRGHILYNQHSDMLGPRDMSLTNTGLLFTPGGQAGSGSNAESVINEEMTMIILPEHGDSHANTVLTVSAVVVGIIFVAIVAAGAVLIGRKLRQRFDKEQLRLPGPLLEAQGRI